MKDDDKGGEGENNSEVAEEAECKKGEVANMANKLGGKQIQKE